MKTLKEIKAIYLKAIEDWNALADQYNQWDNLEKDEKVRWVRTHGLNGEELLELLLALYTNSL